MLVYPPGQALSFYARVISAASFADGLHDIIGGDFYINSPDIQR
ncbi:MAG TPA: hypothetical protein VF813_00920 [Anaerolineaceae bacterium]